MSIRKRLPLVALVLAVSLLSAGCISSLGGGDSSSSALESSSVTIQNGDDLQEVATDRMQNDIETYAFEMNMSVSSPQTDIGMQMDGVTDISNKKMRADTEISMGFQSMSATQYLIDDMQYFKIQDSWQKQETPYQGDTWNQRQIGNQQAMMENASLEIVDNRTFDGHDVYVVEMEVSSEEAKKQMLQQQNMLDSSAVNQIDSIEVQNFESTMYIDADKHVVRYSETDMQYTVDGMTLDMSLTMTMDDFNEDVDIELPDDAEDAPEM